MVISSDDQLLLPEDQDGTPYRYYLIAALCRCCQVEHGYSHIFQEGLRGHQLSALLALFELLGSICRYLFLASLALLLAQFVDSLSLALLRK